MRATKSGHGPSITILDELRPWLDAARETGHDRAFTRPNGGVFDRHVPRLQETSPHDLRHTFLSRLARLGVTPANLQKVAGHASITTTELYTRSSAVDAALAVGEFVRRASREVTPRGGEPAGNRRLTGTYTW